MILKINCRHFVGDRPCKFSKESGLKCDQCNYYSTVEKRILVIKLDALGDVLRTTCLLESLRMKYPRSYIAWITSRNAEEIFYHNSMIDELMFYEDVTTIWKLLCIKYDLMINPDAYPLSSAIAASVIAEQKMGYILAKTGQVIPVNKEAEDWLEMGVFDEYKKANILTYQAHIHQIAKLTYHKSKILLYLSEDEKKFANAFYVSNKMERFKKIVGINTGSGQRWPLKQWTENGLVELIKMLSQHKDIGVLLYGGPGEKYKNEALRREFPTVIDTGCNNTLRQFFALMNLADIILTGDTLALHVATALNKKVVCYFGPTSANEIEDYGIVTKIQPKMDCVVCYKKQCDFKPNCMESISCSMIYEQLIKLI